jgi:hypothetical protein
MKYRIIQFSENEFCAQIKKDWFSNWESIDTQIISLSYTHIKPIVKTFEEAEMIIQGRKEWFKLNKQYPKIHEIK